MLNRKERIKADMIGLCVKGRITAKDAAQRLGLSVRQVENLKKKQREGVSLLHGNCGRSSIKALTAEVKQEILEKYSSCASKPCLNRQTLDFSESADSSKIKEFGSSLCSG